MAEEQRKRGDSTRITRDFFDSLCIEMRHLDAAEPSTSVKIFGETFQTPVMMAALSHLDAVHENGMVAMANGARAAGALMWCGMGDEAELEHITATGAKTVKIIKPYANRDIVYAKMAHAKACGALAVGMDIDHQFGRDGKPDNVRGCQMAPVSTKELEAMIKSTPLPFVVKGVLSVHDAVKCANAGAAGIVVSHHHGLIPYAAPPLMVLPEIVREVGASMSIFMDCAIESGADVFKALALGASAVSIGRPMMDALKENGAQGVTEKVSAVTKELAGIMARTCAADVGQIDPGLLWRLGSQSRYVPEPV